MMLHALLDYAKREDLTAEPGFKPKTVRWLLVFSADGRFIGVQDLRGDDPRSRGREFKACPDLTQQIMVAVGGGCRHFLVDGVDVVVLLTKDGQVDEKLAVKHEFFCNLLDQASSAVAVLGGIAAALRDDTVLESIRAKLAEGKAKPTDLATFAVAGSQGEASVLVEQQDWHAWWTAFRAQLVAKRRPKAARRGRKATGADAGTLRMRCLLSGELVEPQPTHNKIEGLSDVGGLSMGDTLTSFDKDAFGSFALQQGANAAMSEEMVKVYTTALNDLIRHHSYRLAGAKIIYWYSGRVEEQYDALAEVLAGFDRPETDNADDSAEGQTAAADRAELARATNRARRALDAIRSGEHPELGEFRYYALTLSANSGRVVIRDWMEGPFEELLRAVNAWFEDLAIVERHGRRVIQSHKLAAVLAAPLRDLKDATGPLVTSMWRCAVKGRKQPIPHQVMAQTLARVRIDLIQGESPRHARLGLLKAFCNRNQEIPNMTASLNEHETHPAYLCGRIMAILARIQQAALGDVGAGVVQRYYAAASATPALVLGRLVRTAQIAHLPKIDSEGLRRWFDKQLADVWNSLKEPPPRVLTLEEQTLFAMGYYHQSAKRSEKKTDEPGDQEQAGAE